MTYFLILSGIFIICSARCFTLASFRREAFLKSRKINLSHYKWIASRLALFDLAESLSFFCIWTHERWKYRVLALRSLMLLKCFSVSKKFRTTLWGVNTLSGSFLFLLFVMVRARFKRLRKSSYSNFFYIYCSGVSSNLTCSRWMLFSLASSFRADNIKPLICVINVKECLTLCSRQDHNPSYPYRFIRATVRKYTLRAIKQLEISFCL